MTHDHLLPSGTEREKRIGEHLRDECIRVDDDTVSGGILKKEVGEPL